MKDGILKSYAAFLTLPGEKLLVAQRQHWLVLLPQVIIISSIGLILLVASVLVFSLFLSTHTIMVLTTLFIISTMLLLIAKTVVEWLFHLYIITNRKLLEFSYIPLSHFMVNDVILDQVRCTEIDVQAEGVLNDLLDIGDIVITFDRPTHEEEFRLQRIHQAQEISSFLANQLIHIYSGGNKERSSESWYKVKTGPRKYRRWEEIIPEDELENDQRSEKAGGIIYG